MVARSQPPGQTGALWPYPDLAVVRAGGEAHHPCVLLEAQDPAGDHECHAWGYARREDGVAPPGSPASFGFEGVEGDGFLRLKAGQAAPGLSGAPLVLSLAPGGRRGGHGDQGCPDRPGRLGRPDQRAAEGR